LFNYRKETSFLILHSLERKILTRLIGKLGGQERGIDNLGNYQTAKKLLRGNSYLRKWSWVFEARESEHWARGS